jgi:hypothetical protein
MKKIIILIALFSILELPVFAQITATLPDIERAAGSPDEYISVDVSELKASDNVQGFSFFIYYDKNIIYLTEADANNTISASTGLFNADTSNSVFKLAYVNFDGSILKGSGSLMNIKVVFRNPGTTKLTFRDPEGNNTFTLNADTSSIIKDGSVTVKEPTSVEENNTLPADFQLEQNFPNPFNPSTTFEFTIAEPSYTTLKIYNMQGEELKVLVASELSAGKHTAILNAKDFASGVYYARLQSGSNNAVKKILLMK